MKKKCNLETGLSKQGTLQTPKAKDIEYQPLSKQDLPKSCILWNKKWFNQAETQTALASQFDQIYRIEDKDYGLFYS